ncbi:ribonuclease BN (plasmid) [Legionella adelaidensis]|uniref:Ribonuclease BN n=1 Tax=Legionella adelaidensis TaxID=45056 RepID=A0A0W0R438_9GAMM|nr:YihY/virulence factor BrkB family protein [Legionella adelaidensis]KTC65824.1 ribonuclease BN [Legionella adelaidensis]VEH85254.1 ribonuclease BN [Legionella adelaidensis]
MKFIWNLTFFKKILTCWSEDKAPTLSAALAYYTIFSLCPLIIICIAIGGFFLEEEMVQGKVLNQIASLIGMSAAQQIKTMIGLVNQTPTDGFNFIFGIVVLIFGASGFFGQLQTSMNAIWHVKPPKDRGIWKIIKDRFLSVTLVLGVAFLLLVSLILSTVLTTISQYLSNFFPGSIFIHTMLDFIVSMGSITVLFALLFKVLPDVDLEWKDVWIGAFFTAILFSVGKILLSLYLTKGNIGSAFGAAGALIIILVWVFYSAQILFIGAEFTKVYTEYRRNGIKTTKGAKSTRY